STGYRVERLTKAAASFRRVGRSSQSSTSRHWSHSSSRNLLTHTRGRGRWPRTSPRLHRLESVLHRDADADPPDYMTNASDLPDGLPVILDYCSCHPGKTVSALHDVHRAPAGPACR